MTATYNNGIGIMSGTSLDGIDLAWCQFCHGDKGWAYQIRKACTIPYNDIFKQRLFNATTLSALEYAKLNVEEGEYIATAINQWLKTDEKPQYIASHGHTVFHQPEIGLTTQIGSGAVIAARTGITTVCDFRTTDVALKGQGAPLVPIGDELLFKQYDACLNLGGFSNISFRKGQRRIAFDVSPCNMALNSIAKLWGQTYDKDGEMAKSGQVIPKMLNELNSLPYYKKQSPKSLGKEWYDSQFLPIMMKYMDNFLLNDCQRTVTEHIVYQIVQSISKDTHSLLVTGGGAHNKFLIEQLSKKCPCKLYVPDDLTVDFKEALIFAFLGMLRLEGIPNCLNSVTGAIRNCCSGAVYL